MLKRLTQFLNPTRSPLQRATSSTPEVQSVWEETGQVFYLDNTIKLAYTSNSGKVTMERMSLEKLPETLQKIQALPSDSPMAKVRVGDNETAFCISVCAVTWQKRGDRVRIKAIPEAAILRSTTSCFSRSQAIFKHEQLLEHQDVLSTSSVQNNHGTFTYELISVPQFIAQLSFANQQLAKSRQVSATVTPENFDSVFTQHENECIEAIMSISRVKHMPSSIKTDKPR